MKISPTGKQRTPKRQIQLCIYCIEYFRGASNVLELHHAHRLYNNPIKFILFITNTTCTYTPIIKPVNIFSAIIQNQQSSRPYDR